MTITYEHGWTDLDDSETPMRGYRSDVVVSTGEARYRLSFYDPVRLSQEVEDEGHLTECNLVVLREITRANIEAFVQRIFKSGALAKLYRPAS